MGNASDLITTRWNYVLSTYCLRIVYVLSTYCLRIVYVLFKLLLLCSVYGITGRVRKRRHPSTPIDWSTL